MSWHRTVDGDDTVPDSDAIMRYAPEKFSNLKLTPDDAEQEAAMERWIRNHEKRKR